MSFLRRLGQFAFTLLIACSSSLLGDENSAIDFNRKLESGEFTLALQAARSQPLGETRDAMFRRIALAQIQSGSRSSALTSAEQIDGDLARTATLEQINGQFGGAQADFDSLIELIETTVEPDSWEAVGGAGSIQEFRAGVHVDAKGLLRLRPSKANPQVTLSDLRQPENDQTDRNREARLPSPLRKISLPRLERRVQLQLARGERLDDEELHLAGLRSIEYVAVDPANHDLIVAGPAGEWTTDGEGRLVSRETGQAVLHLDDFVLILRHTMARKDASFGCSIDPSAEGLAEIRKYIDETSQRNLRPGGAKEWLRGLRSSLGLQEIRVFGLPAGSRAAQVLVEADYRMKLIGMGLEPSIPAVPSYLQRITVRPGEGPPPLEVLRWWFTLRANPVETDARREVFRFGGQDVQVESENEFLSGQGRRVATGASEPLNRAFASDFTEHFEDLARTYPIYSDLANIFRLATVAAVIESEDLHKRAGWHASCFRDRENYVVPEYPAPRWVETVVSSRRMGGRHIIAGVSGGVRVATSGIQIMDVKEGDVDPAVPDFGRGTISHQNWWWD